MKNGRPTIYTQELFSRAVDYANELPEDEAVHTIEGLADYLGIRRDTIYAWEAELEEDGETYKKPEWRDLIETIRTRQAKSLINNTLMRKFDSKISNLMLGKHGYNVKTETDITSGGDKVSPLMVKFIDADKQ